MGKHSRKVRAKLAARVASWQTAPTNAKGEPVSDSPNRNQVMHKPGSQKL